MATEEAAGHRGDRHGGRRTGRAPLLAQLLEVSPARVEELCAELGAAYADDDRGFELVRVAGGYRFQSHPDLAPYVERFVLEGQTARLSAAALETLAIVAYKQPVSRAQVAVDPGRQRRRRHAHPATRGYIDEVGRDPGPGRPSLYGTTPLLLERLGLDSVDELPPLGPVRSRARRSWTPSSRACEAVRRADSTLGVAPDGEPIPADERRGTGDPAGTDDWADADDWATPTPGGPTAERTQATQQAARTR